VLFHTYALIQPIQADTGSYVKPIDDQMQKQFVVISISISSVKSRICSLSCASAAVVIIWVGTLTVKKFESL